MRSQETNAKELLNLCDRVEVLSEIVHERGENGKELDLECFDNLMLGYYPCLESFFKDIKKEPKESITGLTASFTDDAATFTATFIDKSTKTFSYSKPQEEPIE